jgi:hypothetical protein
MVNITEWSKKVKQEMLNNVQNQLFQLTIIDKKTFDEIVKLSFFLIVDRIMINIKNISLKIRKLRLKNPGMTLLFCNEYLNCNSSFHYSPSEFNKLNWIFNLDRILLFY